MLLVNMGVIFGGLLLTCIKNRKIKKQLAAMKKKQSKLNAIGFDENGERKRSNHVWAHKRRALFKVEDREKA